MLGNLLVCTIHPHSHAGDVQPYILFVKVMCVSLIAPIFSFAHVLVVGTFTILSCQG